MMELPQVNDFESLFLKRTPMLDVRAPIEFSQGAFPCSQNIPLMTDQERDSVGKAYKLSGQADAIKLGHQLVQGDIKNLRVEQWSRFFSDHPQGVLYCFRGGLRSKITQQWIYEHTGQIYPRIEGGYKAMRRYLLEQLELSTQTIHPVMLGGRTGIGKTIFLQKIKQMIDLEGIFHHRGSVFGKHVNNQPSQIDIENKLSIKLLRHRHQHQLHLLFEDEAPNIGSRRIPELLFDKFKQSPLILLEASVNQRVEITFQEYIIDALAEHQLHNGEQKGWLSWSLHLQTSFDKIKRRLGGERHKELCLLLNNALKTHQTHGDTEDHKKWIEVLLVNYYDPMYDYQISKKHERIIFKGDAEQVHDYVKQEFNIT